MKKSVWEAGDTYGKEGRVKRTLARVQSDFIPSGMGRPGKKKQKMIANLLTKKNRELIVEFHRVIVAKGLGTSRQYKYLQTLQALGGWLGKDFDQADKKDIVRVLADHVENNGYEEWTKTNYRQVLKKFYNWLDEGKHKALVADVKATEPKQHTQKRWVLIGEEDVKKIIETAHKPRDAAFFALMWESGGRIAELLNLQVRHLNFQQDGSCKISVEGKTGVRTIKLWMAAPYLRELLNVHQFRNRPDAGLWLSQSQHTRDKPMTYFGIVAIIRKHAEAAGIRGKDINPHAWRHARATFLANKGWSEQQLDKYLGWKFGSDMPRIYIERSGVNVDGACDSLYGILPKEQEIAKDAPARCVRCRELNAMTAAFCMKCGMPLSQETAKKWDDAVSLQNAILMKAMDEQKAESEVLKRRLGELAARLGATE